MLPSGEEIIDDHGGLIDALATGERDVIVKAITDHLSSAATNLTARPAE